MPVRRGNGAKRRHDDSDEEYVETSRATVKAASPAKKKGKARKNGEESTLNENKGRVKPPSKRAKVQRSPSGATQPQAKTKKPQKSRLSDATKVKFTTVEEYEPVGVSTPKLVHDEAFRTCKFIEIKPSETSRMPSKEIFFALGKFTRQS